MVLLVEDGHSLFRVFWGEGVQDLVAAQEDDVVLVGILEFGDGLDEGDLDELVGEFLGGVLIVDVDEEDDVAITAALHPKYYIAYLLQSYDTSILRLLTANGSAMLCAVFILRISTIRISMFCIGETVP